MSPHGTRSRYTNGACRCDACRAAQAAYMRTWERSMARWTTPRAVERWASPWTPEDDRYALEGPGTVRERALALRRTYAATRQRLTRLRARSSA